VTGCLRADFHLTSFPFFRWPKRGSWTIPFALVPPTGRFLDDQYFSASQDAFDQEALCLLWIKRRGSA
jgi:hypothetical protein